MYVPSVTVDPVGRKASVQLPFIEVMAALRMSKSTAVREGFPRTADQVEGYIQAMEYLQSIVTADTVTISANLLPRD